MPVIYLSPNTPRSTAMGPTNPRGQLRVLRLAADGVVTRENGAGRLPSWDRLRCREESRTRIVVAVARRRFRCD